MERNCCFLLGLLVQLKVFMVLLSNQRALFGPNISSLLDDPVHRLWFDQLSLVHCITETLMLD